MTAFRKYATEHPDRHGFHRRPRKTTPSTPPPQNGSGSGSTSSPEPLAPPPARETLDLSLKLFERTLEKVIRHALSEQTIHLHSIGQQLVRMHLALLRELFIPDLVQPAPGGERTSPPPAPQGPAPPESEVGF
jgi:hypothetical protein